MPAYQSPFTGEKRKLPLDSSSRKRVAIENTLGGPSAVHANNNHGGKEYWMIQWYVRKHDESFMLTIRTRRYPQSKKHKTWDEDAVLVLTGSKGTMFDLEGKM